MNELPIETELANFVPTKALLYQQYFARALLIMPLKPLEYSDGNDLSQNRILQAPITPFFPRCPNTLRFIESKPKN